jgi:hypothetical protein
MVMGNSIGARAFNSSKLWVVLVAKTRAIGLENVKLNEVSSCHNVLEVERK